MTENENEEVQNIEQDLSEPKSPLRKSQRNNVNRINYSIDLPPVKKRENRRGLKYQKIDDDVKVKFVQEVLRQNGTIKAAAEKYAINFSTAKAILNTFRKEGRVGKKVRRHHRNSCFLKIKKKRTSRNIHSDHSSLLRYKLKTGNDQQIFEENSVQASNFSQERKVKRSIYQSPNDLRSNHNQTNQKTQLKDIQVKVEEVPQIRLNNQFPYQQYPGYNQNLGYYINPASVYSKLVNQAICYQIMMNELQNRYAQMYASRGSNEQEKKV